jgi:dihydrofolate synthase/folylpolyglutamate synthase
MSRILAPLDHPERRFKSIHVAGTKGKGSTATMIARMLQNSGYKVGLYTSPHLMDVRERITVNGEMVKQAAFTRIMNVLAESAARPRSTQPTYFELLTAVAFRYFADEEVDFAVVETGLGGRLDSTNVISPEVVAITDISYDHMNLLGRTLAEITKEKAGIIKEGIPAVCAPQKAEVEKIIRRTAAELDAPLRIPGREVEFSYRFENTRPIGPHTRLCLTSPRSRFEHLHVPLPGSHQAFNCAVALTVLDELKQRGFEIDDQLAMDGLVDLAIPGRMEMVCDKPRVIVDVAHNGASLDALIRAIGQTIPYDSMIVIFGCNKDKDVAGMLQRIQMGADKIIFIGTGSPRSMDPADLAALYAEKTGMMAQVSRTLSDAMEIAEAASTRDDLICITGSFRLVARAKDHFTRQAALAVS